MSKDFDPDFSEITKPVVKKEAPVQKAAEPQKPVEQKPKLHGASIAIETGAGEYIFKDVVECSGEEFLTFARRVFPLMEGSVQPKDFESRDARIRAFEQIRRYHENGLFNARKGEKSLVN